MSKAVRQIPCLVVSGFLGAGKTTLVRYLLEEASKDGEKVAVVSNEFGELGIDAELFAAGGQAYVELEGGCVCCKLSDDLVETLQMLKEQVEPDRVIVETSGVALPYDTLINFWREPVSQWACDEISVVVVNAEQVYEGRDLGGTFEEQVGSADMLVLNKTDLVGEGALDGVRRTLRDLEPEAPIVHASFGRLDPALLFFPESGVGGHGRRSRSRSPDHHHERFVAEELLIEGRPRQTDLRERLESLGAIRVKGFVLCDKGLCLVQGIGRRIDIAPTDLTPKAEMIGRLVVIRKVGG